MKVSTKAKNLYLDYLTDPSFPGIDRLFVILFENEADRIGHAGYNLPVLELKNYNVMIDEKNVFDQRSRNNIKLPLVKEMITRMVVY